ncbi:energy transducer TonB [Echinicola sp. 20G]|uniref:energy transducer TonB n=1 Tax=Echinicola sp. 20G TaxID=2781961 RepID=UPI00190FF4A1|nr:energy transducer TonB [Echinicola sp. 20G]
MKTNIFLTVLLFLVFSNFGYSQRTILGKILDERTGNPINEVTVELEGNGVKTLTNFRGYFGIEIDSSKYLKFSKDGYFDSRMKIPEIDKFQLYLKPSRLNVPEYKGGIEAFNSFFFENLRYPEEARRKGIQGTFYASFDIDTLGNLGNIQILNAEGDLGGIDMEIKRLLSSLPENWIPSDSIYNFVAPIRFKLNDESDINDSGTKPKYKEGVLDLNALNELVVSTNKIPLYYSPAQRKKTGDQSEASSGAFTIKIASSDATSSFECISADTSKSKLMLRNKSLEGFSKLNQTLNHVKYLDIENCNVSRLPRQLELLPMLEELYAPFNKIDGLPEEFCKLKNLKVVGLGDNKFEIIPKEIYQLEKLEMLDFGNNKIEIIGGEISNLKNMKLLIISKNKLRSLPPSIKELESLEQLYLKGNKISKEEIEKLRKDMPTVEIFD